AYTDRAGFSELAAATAFGRSFLATPAALRRFLTRRARRSRRSARADALVGGRGRPADGRLLAQILAADARQVGDARAGRRRRRGRGGGGRGLTAGAGAVEVGDQELAGDEAPAQVVVVPELHCAAERASVEVEFAVLGKAHRPKLGDDLELAALAADVGQV